MFAVIDLETTGLSPERHDRIVEIAIVQVDAGGAITSEWTTLVNPRRDLGPQHIHGISAADARRAPTFAEAAPAILERLRGRVVVAHNLAFDAPFLASQFDRIGVRVPLDATSGLCTMTLASTYLPGVARSLAACCRAAGVPLENAHCALDDTRAAAMLLGWYLRVPAEADGETAGAPGGAAANGDPFRDAIERARRAAWPQLPPAATFAPVSRSGPGQTRPPFLSRVVDALPRVVSPPASDRYLAVLDLALIGGAISDTDADGLVDLAAQLGLGRDDVARLHRAYVAAVATAARGEASGGKSTGGDDASDAPTPSDAADIRALARMLGVAPPDLGSLGAGTVARPVPRPRFTLAAGDVIAFTGQTREPREALEDRARARGLEVAPSVSREVRLLVAADIDTMSIKARSARERGVPIVGPDAFDAFLAAMPLAEPGRDQTSQDGVPRAGAIATE